MSLLAQAEYPPTPLSASPRQATTDDQLVTLWLHGRAPNTQRAYAADADRFRAFVAKPLAPGMKRETPSAPGGAKSTRGHVTEMESNAVVTSPAVR